MCPAPFTHVWAGDCEKGPTTFTISVVPDQPAHLRSLIRAYATRHSVDEVALLSSV